MKVRSHEHERRPAHRRGAARKEGPDQRHGRRLPQVRSEPIRLLLQGCSLGHHPRRAASLLETTRAPSLTAVLRLSPGPRAPARRGRKQGPGGKFRADYVPQSQIKPRLSHNGVRVGSVNERTRQYYAIHRTRLGLILGNRDLRSVANLARRLGSKLATVRFILSGRYMPSFALGLATAGELGMDPYVFYAWIWERQQERAYWFPEARPSRRFSRAWHVVKPVYTTLPPDPGPGRRFRQDVTPAKEGAEEPGKPIPDSRKPPGAHDWKSFDPKKDPVYLRVMRELAIRRGAGVDSKPSGA